MKVPFQSIVINTNTTVLIVNNNATEGMLVFLLVMHLLKATTFDNMRSRCTYLLQTAKTLYAVIIRVKLPTTSTN